MYDESSLLISILAFLISTGNFFYNRYRTKKLIEYQSRDFKYKEKKDKEDFILAFKDDLNTLRIDLIEINSSKITIDYKDKDQYLYVIEDKYSKEVLTKYLSETLYNKFLDLKIDIDETIDKVIYQKNYNTIFTSSKKMKFFFQSI